MEYSFEYGLFVVMRRVVKAISFFFNQRRPSPSVRMVMRFLLRGRCIFGF